MSDGRLAVTVSSLHFRNPILLAAGTAGYGVELEDVLDLEASRRQQDDEELDPGDPVALAGHYRELQRRPPNLTVVGGCCGTNHRHVAEICAAVTG